MTREVLVVGMLMVSLLGCGKYGPPSRGRTAPEKASTQSAIPADTEEEDQKNPL